jgi:hypothetical protein
MKPGLLLSFAAAALLIAAAPHTAVAADTGLRMPDHVSAAKKKTKKKASPQAIYVTPSARRAYGFRNDPSFDPYGRPWRPNFYATCYEDLGYGRFRDCSDF